MYWIDRLSHESMLILLLNRSMHINYPPDRNVCGELIRNNEKYIPVWYFMLVDSSAAYLNLPEECLTACTYRHRNISTQLSSSNYPNSWIVTFCDIMYSNIVTEVAHGISVVFWYSWFLYAPSYSIVVHEYLGIWWARILYKNFRMQTAISNAHTASFDKMFTRSVQKPSKADKHTTA